MTDEEFQKLSTADQTSYWIGRLLMAIGRGDLRSEVYLMIDYYRREAYQRGVASGK